MGKTGKMIRTAHALQVSRPRLFSLLVGLVAALVAAANVSAALLVQSRGLYVDLTSEGLYTLSPEMTALFDQIEEDVTITFCDDPDRLMAGTGTRYVYVMARALAKRYDNIHLVTVNTVRNPTAIAKYRTTSATRIDPDDVIVSAGGRYRIYAPDSFYTVGESADKERYWSFNGEYKLASAVLSVTSLEQPYVYFTYGHGEAIYVSPDDAEHAALLPRSNEEARALYELMLDAGLRVGYLNLDETDLTALPSDCVLVVLNGPTADYDSGDIYAHDNRSPLDLLHTYLAERYGAMMVFKDPEDSLPNLEELLFQWGIVCDNVYIRDTARSMGDPGTLIADYNTDENQMSYGVYAEVADLPNAPRTIVRNTGALTMAWQSERQGSSGTENIAAFYSPFLYSSDEALAFTVAEGELVYESPARYAVAALSTRGRTDAHEQVTRYSYVFAAATTELAAGQWLSDPAYGNYDLLFALVRYLSRTDEYASMELGGVSLNSSKMGGKQFRYSDLYEKETKLYDRNRLLKVYPAITAADKRLIAVWVLGLPLLAVSVTGVLVYIRRRYR
ncbi:MAG: Gldg family protein [Eubacteriales bacterium]